jgi:predicted Zn-ribbon and HTH transcriptional regulator
MKNTIYAVVIVVCILVAVVVFVSRRGKSGGGIDSIADSKMTWVKCAKCSQGYEMSEKQYYRELEEMAKAHPSPMPVAHPLKCQKCGQEAVRKAYKCEKCGEVFFANSVPGDFEDRCPKCKNSATEASRKARLGQQ